jgi:hypothetical protein
MADLPTSEILAPDKQVVSNLSDLPPIKTRIPRLDRSYDTLQQAVAAVRGGDELDSVAVDVEPAPVDAGPPPAAPAIPSSAPAVEAPVTPRDTPRVRDRIAQLWGQKRDAEERAAALEARLAALERTPPPIYPSPPVDWPAPGANPPYPEPSAPTPFGQAPPLPHAGYVSRAELAALLAQQRQETRLMNELGTAQIASRLEAERDFRDVFENPELRAAAADVWERDRSLQTDPRGPWKAAAIVRGLSATSPAAPGSPAPDARKQALAGTGPTVPAGGTSASPDRAARYNAALRQARQSQRPEDFARARRIQLGQE